MLIIRIFILYAPVIILTCLPRHIGIFIQHILDNGIKCNLPRPVWLGWLESHPTDQRVVGSIPVRAHTWVAGQSLAGVHAGDDCSMFLSHMDVSLLVSLSFPSPLSKD